MSKITDYSKFDRIFWQAGQVPTVPTSGYKSDGTWLYSDIEVGAFALNVADNKVWYRSNSAIIEITNQTPSNLNYLPLSGGVLTGGVTGTTLDMNSIQMDLTVSGATAEGQIAWDNDSKTLSIGLESGSVLQVGQETIVRVVNKTGADIDNGSVVYINGAQGNRPTIALADYSTAITSDTTIGVVTTYPKIADNNNGYVTVRGIVHDLNTNAYSAGTQLYLYTNGTLTEIRPVAPKHCISVGIVTVKDATAGQMLVNIHTGTELAGLHDVSTTGVTTNNTLYYDGTIWRPTASPIFSSLSITSLSSATEHVLVQTASTSQISSIQTENFWITDSTLITSLVSPASWNNGSYTGTTVGAIDGQMYMSTYYMYVYQNSMFTRMLYADYPATVYTGASAVSIYAKNIFCNSSTAFTITLPSATTMVFESIYVKNLGTGRVTVSATTPSTIDGQSSQPLSQYAAMALKIYNNNYNID